MIVKCTILKGLVNTLPAEYAAQTARSRDRVNTWYDMVQKCDLSEAQTATLASTVQVLWVYSFAKLSSYI